MSDFSRAMQERLNKLTENQMRWTETITSNRRQRATAEYGSEFYRQVDAAISAQEAELQNLKYEIADLTNQISAHELSLSNPPLLADDSAQIAADAAQAQRDHEATEAQAQRDHEREMAIIANETARENRLAAEAAAKVAATAQEQANQSVDSLLKGLQGNE